MRITDEQVAIAQERLEPFERDLVRLIEQHVPHISLPLIVTGLTEMLGHAMQSLLHVEPTRRRMLRDHVRALQMIVESHGTRAN